LPIEPVLLGNAGFVQDGHLTDEGLAALRSQMPYADLTSFDRDRRLINMNDLFTVNLLASYIRWKLGTGGEAEKDVQPPPRVSPTPIHQ
jgi:acyl carrier protein